jgi:hypothetical protein
MTILNALTGSVVVAAVLLAGCGKQERLEATSFAKALADTKDHAAAADRIEKEFVANARGWCAAIVGYGAGRGKELEQNAAVAEELAKSALAISTQLGEVRQAIDGRPLTAEYTRGVRNNITNQLTRRQRQLQEIRVLLADSATQFRNVTYAADSYPDGVARLGTLLGSYKAPEDAVTSALAALKDKYKLADSEI